MSGPFQLCVLVSRFNPIPLIHFRCNKCLGHSHCLMHPRTLLARRSSLTSPSPPSPFPSFQSFHATHAAVITPVFRPLQHIAFTALVEHVFDRVKCGSDEYRFISWNCTTVRHVRDVSDSGLPDIPDYSIIFSVIAKIPLHRASVFIVDHVLRIST